jgi:hypothetical protein
MSCISPISAGSVPYRLVQPHTSWIITISAGSVPYQIWTFRRRKKCLNPAGVRTPYLPASSIVSVRLSVVRYKLPVVNKTGSVRINVTLKSVLVTISVVEKQYVSYFECVFVCVCVCVCVRAFVALFSSVQCACATLYCYPFACLALPHFSSISYESHDFRFKVTEYNMSVFFSTTASKIFLVLQRIHRVVITNVRCASRKVPCIAVKCFTKLSISRTIF